MCGIAGLLAGNDRSIDRIRQLVTEMTKTLVHRGPNAGGVWAEGAIGLGHRRLSILELSAAGGQPMRSACGRFIIIFNGEIYNHLDLRVELERLGAISAWSGHSDTETLLASIVHWGLDDALKRSNGMFALAIWDRKLRRLSLARDRMGEKPLYWGWAGKDFVFGSELKAIRAHPKAPDAVCRRALAQFLQFLYVPAPRTIHPQLYKLEPGTILECGEDHLSSISGEPIRPEECRGSLSIRRYWNSSSVVEAGATNVINDEAEAISLLEEELDRAVQRQMISDVSLGAFLSGGVDSSTIVALMQQRSSKPVETFTIGFEESGYDESVHASAVARHLGTKHKSFTVTEADALDVIPLLPMLYDEPFADPSQIPTFLVSQAASQHVSVALSGDGADELFGGYNRYLWGPSIWNRLERIPRPARILLGKSADLLPDALWSVAENWLGRSGGVIRFSEKVQRVIDRVDARDGGSFYQSVVTEWSGSPIILAGEQHCQQTLLNDPLPSGGFANLAELMMFQDLRTYLPDDILCKVDRAAMGVSLETRAPFLDPNLVALAARLPLTLKIRGKVGKWALRQVLYKYVPPEIIDRPKAGFAIPLGMWLRGPLKAWAENLLAPERLEKEGYFAPAAVRDTWNEHQLGRRDWSNRLWSILMFQTWHDEWRGR